MTPPGTRLVVLYTPLLLVACTSVSVLATALYAPSLPHLGEILGGSDYKVQLTMSLNLAAFAAAQLLHGPLAEICGRKRWLCGGLWFFACASAICAFAWSMEMLITGRVLQGLASGVPPVVVLLLIRQFYSGTESIRVMGFHGMVVGMAPIIGPVAGGYLFVWFGWQMSFWVLAVAASIVACLVALYVPATPVLARAPKLGGDVLRAYGRLLQDRKFMRRIAPVAAIFGALLAITTSGPFVFIEHLGVPTERYGVYYGAILAGAILGGFIANRLGERAGLHQLASVAVHVAMSGVVLVSFVVFIIGVSPLSLALALSLYSIGLGLMNATGPILALDGVDPVLQAPAAALVGSSQLGAASLACYMVGVFHDGTARPMAVVMLVFVTFGLIAHFERYQFKKKEPQSRPG